MREGVTGLHGADFQLTRLAMVRDRAAEEPGGRAVMRVVRVSEFCRLCATQRGEVTSQLCIEGRHRYVATYWHNPCGHLDNAASIIAEAELSCAAPDCVLLVSDAHYPYCSPSCAPHENVR